MEYFVNTVISLSHHSLGDFEDAHPHLQRQDSVVAVSAWGEAFQRRRCAGSMYFRQRKSSAINSLICLRKSRCTQRRSGAANPSLLLRSLTRSGIIPRTACLTAYLLHPSRTLRRSGSDTPYSTSL